LSTILVDDLAQLDAISQEKYAQGRASDRKRKYEKGRDIPGREWTKDFCFHTILGLPCPDDCSGKHNNSLTDGWHAANYLLWQQKGQCERAQARATTINRWMDRQERLMHSKGVKFPSKRIREGYPVETAGEELRRGGTRRVGPMRSPPAAPRDGATSGHRARGHAYGPPRAEQLIQRHRFDPRLDQKVSGGNLTTPPLLREMSDDDYAERLRDVMADERSGDYFSIERGDDEDPRVDTVLGPRRM
jgi:hypothetical protein